MKWRLGHGVALSACLLVTFLYFILQTTRNVLYILSNTLETTFSLATLLLTVYSLKKTNPMFTKPARWLAAGFLFWFVGESTYSFYALFLGIEIPYPSLADAFWLAAYPLVLIGMFVFMHRFRFAISRQQLITAFAVATLASGLVVVFLIGPVLALSSDLLTSIVDFAYPIFDVAMLFFSLLGVLAFWGGSVGRGWYWLTSGTVLFAIGDVLFSYLTVSGTYYGGHPMELLYYYGYTSFALCVYSQLGGLFSK